MEITREIIGYSMRGGGKEPVFCVSSSKKEVFVRSANTNVVLGEKQTKQQKHANQSLS